MKKTRNSSAGSTRTRAISEPRRELLVRLVKLGKIKTQLPPNTNTHTYTQLPPSPPTFGRLLHLCASASFCCSQVAVFPSRRRALLRHLCRDLLGCCSQDICRSRCHHWLRRQSSGAMGHRGCIGASAHSSWARCPRVTTTHPRWSCRV